MQPNARITAATLFALIVGAAQPLAAAPPRYRVEFIAPAHGAAAINIHGQVAGTIIIGSDARAFVSDPATGYRLLPLPAGWADSRAADINDSGVIVGAADEIFAERGHAVAWIPDGSGGYEIQFLGQLPGSLYVGSVATAINNLGDIVGYTIRQGADDGPSTLFSDPPVDLSALGLDNRANGVNDDRIVVGGRTRLDLNTLSLEFISEASIYAWDINDDGQVAGHRRYTTELVMPVRYTDGIGWEDLLPGGTKHGSAYGVARGGVTILENSATVFVHLRDEGPFALNNLLADGSEAWVFWASFRGDVNDRGQITTTATNLVSGDGGVVRLTPVDSCYADCDGSGELDFFDFLCFQDLFGSGDPIADCDASGALDFFDFLCFQNAFSAGCP